MVFFGNFLLTTKESYSCRSTKLPIPRPAFSYPLSVPRLCQHSFPLPLAVAEISPLPNYNPQIYHTPCPTGTPTFAALRRQRRDLIIATRPAHQPLPSLLSAAAAQEVQAIPEPTTMSPTAPIPRDQHRQICTCPPRAKGPLDRRSKRLSFPHFFLRRKKCGRRRPPPRQGKIDSPPQRRNPPRAKGSLNRRFEWFSLVTFFLQKKKVTRAGARNAPPRARKRKKRDGPRRLFLYLISCPCGSATPAPAPARISASCSPPPACHSGCPARSTSRRRTWPR